MRWTEFSDMKIGILHNLLEGSPNYNPQASICCAIVLCFSKRKPPFYQLMVLLLAIDRSLHIVYSELATRAYLL